MNKVIEANLQDQGQSMVEDAMLEHVEGSRDRRIDRHDRGSVRKVIAYDFVKAFYEEQRINVGVEIMAMRSLVLRGW